LGTNIYAIPQVTDEEKLVMMDCVLKSNWEDLENIIPEKVHIGKNSFGWMFAFNRNGARYYDPNRDSIGEFLSECKIVDEYGTEISWQEFWHMVDSSKDGWWEKTYKEANPGMYTGVDAILWEPEEIIDGLRFSAYTEFS